MKLLPTDIAQLQAVCGTRVILDGESQSLKQEATVFLKETACRGML